MKPNPSLVWNQRRTGMWVCLLSTACCATWGCGRGQSRIYPLDVDPGWLSDQLVAEFDTDSNGALSESELQGIPPINDSRTSMDTDGNGELSPSELEYRFEAVFHPEIGLLPARCRVTQNGRPLIGASVRFVPPKVLEGVLPPASGVTDSDGTARLRLALEDMPKNIPNPRMAVMRPGIYLVEVAHPDVDIPAKYNTSTTLGKVVYSEVLNGPPLPIKLEM